ncbi:LiaF transmembrane domain-containing protein [Paenibacillus ginsengihumi]|uniref:LiaF transmembrane domain-containing protein n=1 Tax=Paenibacillus ginsengihumi TaxID=431596 RepID=UPI00035CECBF|nr:hypothetical protein [Paenibacillus ginsengihumi]
MRMNKNLGIALLLIAFGGILLLNKLGFHTGHMMSWLFPIALVFLGWIGMKNGRTAIGVVLLVLGGLMLLGKMSGLIVILVAIGLIVYGITMLRNNNSAY